MVKPFLLNFAKTCVSPARTKNNDEFYYDHSKDLVCRSGFIDNPPAIELSGEYGPRTKKCDIEKGEDNKDRRMWL